LIARERRIGDRDSRTEDRQLLLDAVLAAEEHLVITYTGRDPRTNAVRPPAVPLGELLDVIDRTVRVAGRLPRAQVGVQHPLQPFDPRNFAAKGLGTDGPWSFDPVNLAGSQASLGARRRSRVLDGVPLAPAPRNPVELDRLVQFVEHPIRAFLRQRLGAVLGWDSEEPDDALPLEMDPLERWAVGDRMLRRRLAGLDVDRCRRAELASGALPPGTLGDRILDQLGPRVEELVRAAGLVVDRAADPETVDVTVELPGGRVLVGSVSGCVGDVLLAVTYSQLAAKHRLAAWVRLLALAAAHPDRSWTARSIGRGPSASRPVRTATAALAGGDPDSRRTEAVELLARVVDLYD
ncbi:MAG: exodeoxyribonuclease V subunit gamma, partial [Acidimicrobiales bacterium]